MDRENLRMTVYASLLAALTAAGSYLYIPVGPVPIYLANLFIFLAGLLLGSKWGLASVGIYLLAGACGLPVFAGGTGGIGRFAGPTGGYLIGFLLAVCVIGIISERGRAQIADVKESSSFVKQPGIDVLAMICGTVIIYAVGITWLKIVTGMSLGKALAVGMYPFLLGDALKIVAAVPIAKALRPLITEN
jgi:biotin transport system substrate-specific component